MVHRWLLSHILSCMKKLKSLRIVTVKPAIEKSNLAVAWRRKMQGGDWGFLVANPLLTRPNLVAIRYKDGGNNSCGGVVIRSGRIRVAGRCMWVEQRENEK